MERISTTIADYLINQSWQVVTVFALVAAACWGLRKASAHCRYLLWLVVLAKCLVPGLIGVPVPVLPQEAESQQAWSIKPTTPIASAPVVESTPLAATRSEIPDPQTVVVPSNVHAAKTISRMSLNLHGWLTIAWLAGVGLCLTYVSIKAWSTQRSLSQTRRMANQEIQTMVAPLAKRLGLKTIPTTYIADGIAQPFVWGWLRGSIYLPEQFVDTGTHEQQQGILTHELAHFARWDAAANLVQVVVQVAFFFHPLIWWTNRQVRREREKCCDEIVIAGLGANPRQYSKAIVDALVAQYEINRPITSLAVAGPLKNIEERIRTILSPNKKFYRRPSRAAVVTVVLLTFFAVSTTFIVTAQDDPARPRNDKANLPILAIEKDNSSGFGTANSNRLSKPVTGAGAKTEYTASAVVPTPTQVLEKLRARRDSVENLVVEASWEDYQNGKPSSWEDGAIYRDKQGRIRVRYHHGPGALESANKKDAKRIDEIYDGKFTVNIDDDPTRDRLGKALKPGEIAEPANHYRSVMIYNGKWPGDHVNAESHRNPFKCMDESIISDLSRLLVAGKAISVEPVKGQHEVYELGYELDAKDDPNHLTHHVLVDAGKGWVITRDEHLFPNGKSARLSTCDYRRSEDGWWLPTVGQFRFLWGGTVPTLDWRFKVGRVVVNDPHFDQTIFQPELEAFPLRELTESVAGIVVDPEGNPVEGASIRADLHSGPELLMAFAWQPTGKDGRFAIDGLPNAPIPIMAFIEPPPGSKDRSTRFPAELTAKPGQKDLRIVLDPKLVRGKN
jgi:beta-lactamase regulating signal transducer with metallopeptidase domain